MAFKDISFPAVRMAPSGGPMYRTTVLRSASGREQRNEEFEEARYKWNVAPQSWDEASLGALISFIHVVGGAAHTFRFRDPSDYTCGMVRDGNDWAHDTPHQFATGNGSATQFQLTKTYAVGAYSRVRKIYLPVNGSIQIYKNGTLQSSGFTINYATGVVTFSVAPANGQTLEWSGKFDIKARLDSDEMNITKESVAMGTWSCSVVGVIE